MRNRTSTLSTTVPITRAASTHNQRVHVLATRVLMALAGACSGAAAVGIAFSRLDEGMWTGLCAVMVGLVAFLFFGAYAASLVFEEAR